AARLPAAPRAHRVDSGDRLEGANQHGSWIVARLSHGVETPVHPVGEIDVRGARWAVQRLRARGAPVPVGMTRGIVWPDIRLHLHDPAGGPPAASTHVADQD